KGSEQSRRPARPPQACGRPGDAGLAALKLIQMRAPSLRGATRRSNPWSGWAVVWIASRSLSSGGTAPVIGRAFARPVGADPLARNDGECTGGFEHEPELPHRKSRRPSRASVAGLSQLDQARALEAADSDAPPAVGIDRA